MGKSSKRLPSGKAARSSISGFKNQTRCAACGGRIVDARWDSLAGGVVCARHADRDLPVITAGDMAVLRACVQGPFAPAQGDVRRLCRIAGDFVRAQLERDFDALTLAESLDAQG